MIFKFSAGEICVIKCVFRYGIISAIIFRCRNRILQQIEQLFRMYNTQTL